MSNDFEWIAVPTNSPIGAIGFLGNDIAAVVSFYEDKDWDHDGEVSLGERFGSFFSMKGAAYLRVLTAAYANPDIMMRDSSLRAMQGQATVSFASGMISEGVYKAYFGVGVTMVAGGIAKSLTSSMVKQLVIKKSMEKAAKEAFSATVF